MRSIGIVLLYIFELRVFGMNAMLYIVEFIMCTVDGYGRNAPAISGDVLKM